MSNFTQAASHGLRPPHLLPFIFATNKLWLRLLGGVQEILLHLPLVEERARRAVHGLGRPHGVAARRVAPAEPRVVSLL
jgi:hypothetical protein